MSEPVDINKLRERLGHLTTYSHSGPFRSGPMTATVSINREVLNDVLAGILDLIAELNASRQQERGYPGRLQLKSFRRGEQSSTDGGKTWVHDKSGEAAGFGSPELDPVRERGMKEPPAKEPKPQPCGARIGDRVCTKPLGHETHADERDTELFAYRWRTTPAGTDAIVQPEREEKNPYTHAAAVVEAVLTEANRYARCGVNNFTEQQLKDIVRAAHGALKVVDRERVVRPARTAAGDMTAMEVQAVVKAVLDTTDVTWAARTGGERSNATCAASDALKAIDRARGVSE